MAGMKRFMIRAGSEAGRGDADMEAGMNAASRRIREASSPVDEGCPRKSRHWGKETGSTREDRVTRRSGREKRGDMTEE